MIVQAFECATCGDTLFGRATEDIQTCHCGTSVLLGDHENPKIEVNKEELMAPPLFDLEIDISDPKVLYYDWNLRLDNYGVITEHTFVADEAKKYSVTKDHLIEY